MHVDVALMVVGEGAEGICTANQQYAVNSSKTKKALKPCNVLAGISPTK